MAQLPARPLIALDTLRQRAQPPRRGRALPRGLPSPRPLADLERASSLAPLDATPRDEIAHATATAPSSLALWITVRTCQCGAIHRCPPDYALVRYETNAHTVHWTRAELSQLERSLPRELREKHVTIPFCEECFDNV